MYIYKLVVQTAWDCISIIISIIINFVQKTGLYKRTSLHGGSYVVAYTSSMLSEHLCMTAVIAA